MSWRTARSCAFVERLGDPSPLIRTAAYNNIRTMADNHQSSYSHGLLTTEHLEVICAKVSVEADQRCKKAARDCLAHIADQGRHSGLRMMALTCLAEVFRDEDAVRQLADPPSMHTAEAAIATEAEDMSSQHTTMLVAESVHASWGLPPPGQKDPDSVLRAPNMISVARYNPWAVWRDEARAVFHLVTTGDATTASWRRAGATPKLIRKLKSYTGDENKAMKCLRTALRASVQALRRLKGGGILVQEVPTAKQEATSPPRRDAGVSLVQWESWLQDMCHGKGGAEEAGEWLASTLSLLRQNLLKVDSQRDTVSWEGEESPAEVWAAYKHDAEVLYLDLATGKPCKVETLTMSGSSTAMANVLTQKDLLAAGATPKLVTRVAITLLVRFIKQHNRDGPIFLEHWSSALENICLSQGSNA